MGQKFSPHMRKAWLYLNLMFISIYSIYLLSWIMVLPGVDFIPRLAYNILLAAIYSLTIDFKDLTLQNITQSHNILLVIFFMTNPRLLFILPYYLNSLMNTSSAVLFYSKMKKYWFYKYFAMIERQKMNLIFIANMIQILLIPVMIGATLIGFNTLSSALSFFYMFRMSLTRNAALRDALVFLIEKIDGNTQDWPNEFQQIYSKFKNYIQLLKSGELTDVKDNQ